MISESRLKIKESRLKKKSVLEDWMVKNCIGVTVCRIVGEDVGRFAESSGLEKQ